MFLGTVRMRSLKRNFEFLLLGLILKKSTKIEMDHVGSEATIFKLSQKFKSGQTDDRQTDDAGHYI